MQNNNQSNLTQLRLAITVVTSNKKLIVPFLETLKKQLPQHNLCQTQTYVIWNGPGRGLPSLDLELQKNYPWVDFQESSVSGFPTNQNILLRKIVADYYLIMNDDVEFLEGSISRPLEFMLANGNERIGILSVRLLNKDGSLQPSTYKFAGVFRALIGISGLRRLLPLSDKLFFLAKILGYGDGKSQYWNHNKTVDVDSFRGAYMLVRGTAMKEVGLWNEDGGEETEWHYRFHSKNWRVTFFSGVEVIHLKSMTVSTDPYADLVCMNSFLIIFKKHENFWRYTALKSGCYAIYLFKLCFGGLMFSKKRVGVALEGLRILHKPR